MNKKKLIVVATQAELAPLFAYYKLPAQTFIQMPKFDLLITGVGMTATAFALGKHLTTEYHLVLNVGIAGAFDRQLLLGDLINITKDVFAELGAEDKDNFIPIDDMGFGKNSYFSTYDDQDSLIESLRKVNAISVNKVHGNSKSIDNIENIFNPQAESMEGAAVFYACELMGVKSLQIRSISNYVTERNTADWQIPLAIQNLNNWLINYLNQ